MKKLILSLVALLTATMSYAQATLVATLSHEGEVSMFYGAYGLQKAMAAANNGDVITLSGGSFQATTIDKAVAIRGAGIEVSSPTYIVNKFTINIASDVTERLLMEGVKVTGRVTVESIPNGANFLGCTFYEIDGNNSSSIMKNAIFSSCRITDSYYLRGTCDATFLGCYVSYVNNQSSETASASLINCVIGDGHNLSSSHSCMYENCVFEFQSYSSCPLPSSVTATNCVCFVTTNYDNSSLFSNVASASGCRIVKSDSFTFFKTYTGTYSDTENFELTDAAKATYLGTDGTEIGMHGGYSPYDATPSYPLISNMSVSAKTSGVLNVDIEISNP